MIGDTGHTPGKRGYRYKIAASGGCLAEKAEPGTYWVDWTYFGRGHTWTVYDFAKGEETGWARGVYVDKGRMVGGKYVPDAKPVSGEVER